MNAAALPQYNSQIDLNGKPADCTSGDVSDHRRQVAEKVLDCHIEWLNEVTGFLDCPGIEFHSAPDGRKDCRVKTDGLLMISYFRQSCQEPIDEPNRKLRRGLSISNFSTSIVVTSTSCE